MDKYALFNPPLPKKKQYKEVTNYDDKLYTDFDDFSLTQGKTAKINNYANEIFSGTYSCPNKDPLTRLFFSSENINKIQKGIRKEIYRRTNGKVKLGVDQDTNDVLVSMRAVFMDNAKFLPIKILKQVEILNKQVIDYVVPDMMTAILQYNDYIRDINNPLRTIDRPINSSNSKNSLPSITSLWK
jgi:hypothetical protein